MPASKPRAADLNLTFGTLQRGPSNTIVDVPGIAVGHATVSWGEPPGSPGAGPARTGVTVVVPRLASTGARAWLAAGVEVLNGYGELTGLPTIREWGTVATPIFLTTSMSLGTVYQGALRALCQDPGFYADYEPMPVVTECDDSYLNDARGFHVHEEHVFEAIAAASAAPVEEGCVGAGTGMQCFQFKGGIGSSSRLVDVAGERYVLGALVLTNFGVRERLTIAGVPVGREIPDLMPPRDDGGSCIVVVATNAPLLPDQCERLARRAGLGLARTGSVAGNTSGEIMLAVSTAQPIPTRSGGGTVACLAGRDLSRFFAATVDSVEESVVNALLAARTTWGRAGHVLHELPVDRLRDILGQK